MRRWVNVSMLFLLKVSLCNFVVSFTSQIRKANMTTTGLFYARVLFKNIPSLVASVDTLEGKY